jgi:hypothetical protein
VLDRVRDNRDDIHDDEPEPDDGLDRKHGDDDDGSESDIGSGDDDDDSNGSEGDDSEDDGDGKDLLDEYEEEGFAEL